MLTQHCGGRTSKVVVVILVYKCNYDKHNNSSNDNKQQKQRAKASAVMAKGGVVACCFLGRNTVSSIYVDWQSLQSEKGKYVCPRPYLREGK
jgi:hypothetical protein